ncbi:MAG: PspC domain-containing protein [Firmicutes bacterium]|nr:PspC domain-containing protein [Bacillota bacterium]
MDAKKNLYRSTGKRMLGGVCGGIAEYFGIDATIIRLLYVILTLFTACFPGVILYIICLFVIPEDPGYTDIQPS